VEGAGSVYRSVNRNGTESLSTHARIQIQRRDRGDARVHRSHGPADCAFDLSEDGHRSPGKLRPAHFSAKS